jgi:hypothetical protein
MIEVTAFVLDASVALAWCFEDEGRRTPARPSSPRVLVWREPVADNLLERVWAAFGQPLCRVMLAEVAQRVGQIPARARVEALHIVLKPTTKSRRQIVL